MLKLVLGRRNFTTTIPKILSLPSASQKITEATNFLNDPINTTKYLKENVPTKDLISLLNLFKNDHEKYYLYIKHLLISIDKLDLVKEEDVISCIAACDLHQDIQGVMFIVQKMKESGMHLSDKIFQLYLSSSLNYLEKDDKGFILAKNVEKLDYNPLNSYKVLQQVLGLFSHLPRVNVDALQMIITHLITIGEYNGAFDILQKFYSCFKHDELLGLCSFYIHECLWVRGLNERAMAFHDWMVLNMKEYNSLLPLLFKGFMNNHDFYSCIKVFVTCLEERVYPPRDDLECLLELHFRYREIEGAYHLLTKMIDIGRPPTSEAVYRFFMSCMRTEPYVNEQSYETVVAPILKRLLAENYMPSVELKYGLAKCFLKIPPTLSFLEQFRKFLEIK